MGFLAAVGFCGCYIPRSHHNGVQAALVEGIAHRAAGCAGELAPRSASAWFGNANRNPEALHIGRPGDGFGGSNPQRFGERAGDGQFAIAAPGAVAGSAGGGGSIRVTGAAANPLDDAPIPNFPVLTTRQFSRALPHRPPKPGKPPPAGLHHSPLDSPPKNNVVHH